MTRISKTVKKLSAFLVGCVLLVGVAMPASAQINSIGELLDKVRQDARQTQAENARREADFKSRRDQQSSKLAAARAELNRLEAQVRRVERQFEANEDVIAQLDGELNSALGEFRDVFGLARQSAGEFKATLDSSLVSAQYPRRTEVLGKIANSKALPSSTELDAIWKSMLGEIEAQRQVVTFEANVGNSDNPEVPMALTRVGGFNVFTNDGADFLEYKNTKEPGVLPLTFLNKQPGGQINKAAQDVLNAGPGDLVFGPVDPTRGSLLKALERVPTVVERVGNPFLFNGGHGGGIGVIIGWVLIIGAVFGIFNIIRLFLISSAVRAQKKKAHRLNPTRLVAL